MCRVVSVYCTKYARHRQARSLTPRVSLGVHYAQRDNRNDDHGKHCGDDNGLHFVPLQVTGELNRMTTVYVYHRHVSSPTATNSEKYFTGSYPLPLWSGPDNVEHAIGAACSTSTPSRPAGHSDSRFTNNWYTATPAAITYITPISPSLVNRNKQQSRRRHLNHRIH